MITTETLDYRPSTEAEGAWMGWKRNTSIDSLQAEKLYPSARLSYLCLNGPTVLTKCGLVELAGIEPATS